MRENTSATPVGQAEAREEAIRDEAEWTLRATLSVGQVEGEGEGEGLPAEEVALS